jgi:hypothetical protein
MAREEIGLRANAELQIRAVLFGLLSVWVSQLETSLIVFTEKACSVKPNKIFIGWNLKLTFLSGQKIEKIKILWKLESPFILFQEKLDLFQIIGL